MKIKTKIVTTLIVGIALFTGTIGVASASPHYSDWSSTRVIEKSAQAVRIDHPTIKRSANLYTPSFKTTMINSHGEEASNRAQAPKNVVRATPRPQLPDETVCLSNIKVWELQNTETAFTAFMVANEKNTIEPAAFSQWDFTTTERSFPYIGASL